MKKLLFALLFAGSLSAASAAPLWMRYPAISPDGSRIAFAYKGDLYVVPATGGEARCIVSDAAYDYAPVWSPDGRTIAYASDRYGNFDLFVVPSEGGVPRRLTTHSAAEVPTVFSADGKQIYFNAQIFDPAESALFPKASMSELYRVSVEGGRPEQVLATPAEELALLPGGSFLYQDCKGGENSWRKHHTSSIARDIWHYDAATGKHAKLTSFAGEDRQPRLAPDGRTVYYLSEQSGSFNVWSFPLDRPEETRQVTKFKTHPVRFLSVAQNGTLCFGFNGEIYTCASASAKPVKVSVAITPTTIGDEQRVLSVTGGTGAVVSPDGKQIAFLSRGEVFVTSADYATTRQITHTAEAERDLSFAKDNRTLAYASERGGQWNIYTARIVRDEDPNFPNAVRIEETPLFNDAKHERFQPQYSPDGREIAYVEDRSRLMVKNLDSGKVRQITDGSTQFSSGGEIDYAWSPDGQWFVLAYTGNRHDPYSDIGIVRADGKGGIINLTNSGYTDQSPEWVLDGNAILFISERYGMRNHASWGTLDDAMLIFLNQEAYDKYRLSKEDYELWKEAEKKRKSDAGKKEGDAAGKADAEKADKGPKPIVVELRGIEDRIERLTPSSSSLSAATIDKQGDKLYYVATFNGTTGLWQLDLRDKSNTQLQKLDGAGALLWDAKQENLFVASRTRIAKMKTGTKELKPVAIRAEMQLDPQAERAYMFDRVYRQEKHRFYTETMHGVDWEAMRDNYAQFLPHIDNNYDFAELLSEWLGELNVSHTGGRYAHPATAASSSTAELGLFFDPAYAGDGLKIAEVVEKGPFDRAASKVAAGDVIEAIDGTPVKRGTDWYPLLDRKAGQKVLVSLRRPSDNATWEEVVVPVTRAAWSQLLYRRWVKQRAADVDRLSNGRLGYVHIESMGDPSFRTVYSDILGKYNDREGIVIDTRFNGGGRLHEDIEVLFSGEKYFTQVVRGKEACDMPSRRWNKPSIMITCEANYSNAHGTPWVYRHRGIGRLVGMPVPGTMTSVSWERLQDPTLVFGIPVVGYRLADGSYLENQQLEPDIRVANAPERIVKGEDEQLAAAVKALLEEIDARKK